jgi:peptide/nickel transport system permease protein
MLQRLKELRAYPSAVAGLVIIVLLVIVSIYTIIAIPYAEAVRLWRAGPGVWDDNPRTALPVWVDWFTKGKLPRTIIVGTADGGTTTAEALGNGQVRVAVSLPFEYDYDGFPTEIKLFSEVASEGTVRSTYSVLWRMPSGEAIPLTPKGGRSLRSNRDTFYITQDAALSARLPAGVPTEVGLLLDTSSAAPGASRIAAKGLYEVLVEAEIPEGADLSVKLVVYGRVHGIAGTDHLRRDLMVGLLWGTPLALIFGFLAAIGSTLLTFALAGIGAWFGGWLDSLFQRITQVNMIIPMLPVLIMVGQFYNRSLWLMLALIVLLSIFSGGLLSYRAMFLQAKEAAYIEAAMAYGAKDFRIIFRYLLPRIVPVLLPTFVMTVPSFVFLEASLAVIGLGDPIMPTWGKIINDAQSQSALYKGFYFWVLEPAVLLMLTGFAFAMVGYALDRILNPRLRTV